MSLKLKERVKNKELEPQQALDLLRATDPIHADQTRTADWLKRRGAK